MNSEWLKLCWESYCLQVTSVMSSHCIVLQRDGSSKQRPYFYLFPYGDALSGCPTGLKPNPAIPVRNQPPMTTWKAHLPVLSYVSIICMVHASDIQGRDLQYDELVEITNPHQSTMLRPFQPRFEYHFGLQNQVVGSPALALGPPKEEPSSGCWPFQGANLHSKTHHWPIMWTTTWTTTKKKLTHNSYH